MFYDEQDFNFSMPVIDTSTPHDQVSWTQHFMAIQERFLVNCRGYTPDQAAQQILEREALHNRTPDKDYFGWEEPTPRDSASTAATEPETPQTGYAIPVGFRLDP